MKAQKLKNLITKSALQKVHQELFSKYLRERNYHTNLVGPVHGCKLSLLGLRIDIKFDLNRTVYLNVLKVSYGSKHSCIYIHRDTHISVFTHYVHTHVYVNFISYVNFLYTFL